MNAKNKGKGTIDEFSEQWKKEDEALMAEFNAKLNAISLAGYDEYLATLKKGEADLLTLLDSSLKEFEDKIRGKVFANQDEAEAFIKESYKEGGMPFLGDDWRMLFQHLGDLQNIGEHAIAKFKEFIDSMKEMTVMDFSAKYKIINDAKAELEH